MKLKKSFLILSVMSLSACSSISSMFTFSDENETILKPNESEVKVIKLNTAGLNLPSQDPEFVIPNIDGINNEDIDIVPPVISMAIIPGSKASFNKKNAEAEIIYPYNKKDIYNLEHMANVLKDKNIGNNIKGSLLLTDWVKDDNEVMIKYKIEQIVIKPYASTLYVSIEEIKRNGEVIEPSTEYVRRKTVTLLNMLIGTLNKDYNEQKNALMN